MLPESFQVAIRPERSRERYAVLQVMSEIPKLGVLDDRPRHRLDRAHPQNSRHVRVGQARQESHLPHLVDRVVSTNVTAGAQGHAGDD